LTSTVAGPQLTFAGPQLTLAGPGPPRPVESTG
jgi:hypothetical protein